MVLDKENNKAKDSVQIEKQNIPKTNDKQNNEQQINNEQNKEKQSKSAGKYNGNNEEQNFEPKIIAFLCNWCSYAAADLAGSSRIQYPTNIRIIRIPCTGRLNPLLIIKAFRKGADGVLVSGCHPGDCHYIDGNYYARRRFSMLKELLEFSGVEEQRVNYTWCSAAEGHRFAEVVEKVVNRIKSVGPWKGFIDETDELVSGKEAGEIIDEEFLSTNNK